MKHLGNDIAHFFFTAIVLFLSHLGLWGCVLAGLAIGLLTELKEENSNILKVSWSGINFRDICGYMLGGAIIGLILN